MFLDLFSCFSRNGSLKRFLVLKFRAISFSLKGGLSDCKASSGVVGLLAQKQQFGSFQLSTCQVLQYRQMSESYFQ